jgi:hypothetical protein
MALQTFAAPDAAIEEQPANITVAEPFGHRTGNQDVAVIGPSENPFRMLMRTSASQARLRN